MSEPEWLTLARELQALAQAGLAYSKDPFDQGRFERIRELAASVMAWGSGNDLQRILDLFRQDVGYPTPKVDVRGAVFRDNRILMVRESSDGLWTLPGGWADVNQSAAESVVREIAEESGYQARAVRLAAVWDRARQNHPSRHPHTVYKMFFICELTGGSPSTSIETTGVDFFPQDALPPLSVDRVTQRQILRMFAYHADARLPTEFD